MTITILKPGLALIHSMSNISLPIWGNITYKGQGFQHTPSVIALGLQHKFPKDEAMLFWFDKLPIMPL